MTNPSPYGLSPYEFTGFRVIESESLTVPGEPYEQRRTWRERLFAWPWHPLQATRTVVPQVPSTECFLISGNTVMMHPQTARRLRELLKEK